MPTSGVFRGSLGMGRAVSSVGAGLGGLSAMDFVRVDPLGPLGSVRRGLEAESRLTATFWDSTEVMGVIPSTRTHAAFDAQLLEEEALEPVKRVSVLLVETQPYLQQNDLLHQQSRPPQARFETSPSVGFASSVAQRPQLLGSHHNQCLLLEEIEPACQVGLCPTSWPLGSSLRPPLPTAIQESLYHCLCCDVQFSPRSSV